jgi:hypothetical protein
MKCRRIDHDRRPMRRKHGRDHSRDLDVAFRVIYSDNRRSRESAQ